MTPAQALAQAQFYQDLPGLCPRLSQHQLLLCMEMEEEALARALALETLEALGLSTESTSQ